MEEIKVGEYCRIRGGHIRKVTKIMPVYENDLLLSDSYWITFDNLGNIGTYKNKQLEGIIVKHSKKLIDLIEEGDYVNGYLVQQIDKDGFIVIHNGGYTFRSPNWIKSIVTKEQFKSVEYIVGESNG